MPLIINADDFGLSQGVNDAVFELAALGSLSSTTVMVNMPFASQVKSLYEFEYLSVGLHFNLTEGRPIAPCHQVASLLNAEGKFYSNSVFRKRLSNGLIRPAEMRVELEAQFQRLSLLLGGNPSHIDSHHNIHKAPGVARVFHSFITSNALIGVRAPARYILWLQDDHSVISASAFNSIRQFELRQAFAEIYLHWITNRFKRVTAVPAGELYAQSFQKLDLIQALSQAVDLDLDDSRAFEIACHPATNTDGLAASKLKATRVDEYKVMKSPQFLVQVRTAGLVNFKDLIRDRL